MALCLYSHFTDEETSASGGEVIYPSLPASQWTVFESSLEEPHSFGRQHLACIRHSIHILLSEWSRGA